ncbi:hypothetical protein [Sphaerotilus sp.]|uniref:hypothetical protein n=1 Tax=Sphaerotilus sp. TaxID=2093942 RepID=UPI0034E2810B
MNASLRSPPGDVPTLTEVVRPSELAVTLEVPVVPVEPTVDEERLALQILDDMQARADVLLEARLRERMAPLLAQLADGLVREVRAEFLSGLADFVRQAVAQELARSRVR